MLPYGSLISISRFPDVDLKFLRMYERVKFKNEIFKSIFFFYGYSHDYGQKRFLTPRFGFLTASFFKILSIHERDRERESHVTLRDFSMLYDCVYTFDSESNLH